MWTPERVNKPLPLTALGLATIVVNPSVVGRKGLLGRVPGPTNNNNDNNNNHNIP
jgi:hypothetical protein